MGGAVVSDGSTGDAALEADLARLVAGVLKVDRSEIERTTNLRERFEVDSLQVLQIVAAIENAYDIEIPEDEMELAPTVAEIAAAVERLRDE